MLSLVTLTILLPLLSAAESTHTVKVGSNGLVFDPDNVKAEVGDTVNFEFFPKNHSVAQASYDKPCEPLSEKPIFSGFVPVDTGAGEKDASKMFSMKINNTDPIWLYCSQSTHCQDGQVMVINQMSGTDMTLEKYKDASGKTQMSTSPAEVFGGVMMEHDDDDEPKTTKGNPGTPATATMSTSSSMTMTSTSTSSASQTNAAGKVSAGAFLSHLPPLFAGMSIAGMCSYLA